MPEPLVLSNIALYYYTAIVMISTSLPNIKNYNNSLPQLDDNSVIFACTSGRYFYPEHKTPYLFITNFLNKGKYIVNKKHIEISDKHFYFLNCNDSLEINFFKAVRLQTLIILFDEKFIKNCFYYSKTSDEKLLAIPDNQLSIEVKLPNVPFELTKFIQYKISQLLQKTLQKEDFKALLFELILEFLKVNHNTSKQISKINAVKKSTQEELYRRLFLAKEFMHDNVFVNLTIEEIAQEVCLNKFHFLANFKKLYNTTPHQYFTELKLQRAFQLLQQKQHSVTEVCYLIGFECLGSFSNLFKRRFNISPSSISLQE